jgi:NAD+ synthase (glutamine-hydrolysing)
MRTLRLGLAQINPTVGEIERNVELIRSSIRAAERQHVQLLVVPELSVSGYPPEDLLLRDDFLTACAHAVDRVAAAAVGGMIVCVGAPHRSAGTVRNSLHILQRGRVRGVYDKVHLPNYGVFDERRYFAPGGGPALIRVGDELIGLSVCEDVWLPGDPVAAEAAAGAGLVVNASASPYHRGKAAEREEMIMGRCTENRVALAYCNLVGGQDELVFDGASFVCDHTGQVLARAAQFVPELVVCEVPLPPAGHGRPLSARVESLARSHVPVLDHLIPIATPGGHPPPVLARPLGDEEEVYAALVLGTRDYTAKAGFDRVLLGVSGGVDSALVAAIACDAVGAGNVTCVVMPSRYSSTATQADARKLAKRLGARRVELPIDDIVAAYGRTLADEFGAAGPGTAEQNIQARIRGNLLMALSNRYGGLLLSTGNKSEFSVGYTTLYGDMAGGFAVIKDVPKTLVYRLARWLNETRGDVIPATVLERPASAELAPDQRDTDTLPPYELLDPILERYIERDEGISQITAAGFDEATTRRVIGMVDRAEYKRRQAPPGVKITPRAFGRDRRLPIAGRFVGDAPVIAAGDGRPGA